MNSNSNSDAKAQDGKLNNKSKQNGGGNTNGGNGGNPNNGNSHDWSAKQLNALVMGPKNAECISKDGMVCCPCSEGIKYSYFAPTQCYVPMEYYVPVQCCVPVECEIRYGTPFIPGKDNEASNCQ